MNLKDKNVVVTGGSHGLGLGLVESLVEQGANVWVVARDEAALEAVHVRLHRRKDALRGRRIGDVGCDGLDLEAVKPDVLILNAGATPKMGPFDQVSWADFTTTWDTDVKGGLYWLQAALNLPLAPGSRVLVSSSGAAAYARANGLEVDAFLRRFGAPLSPRLFGAHVVQILSDPQYDTAVALGLKGDTGITTLEGQAA